MQTVKLETSLWAITQVINATGNPEYAANLLAGIQPDKLPEYKIKNGYIVTLDDVRWFDKRVDYHGPRMRFLRQDGTLQTWRTNSEEPSFGLTTESHDSMSIDEWNKLPNATANSRERYRFKSDEEIYEEIQKTQEPEKTFEVIETFEKPKVNF